jgi:uncharacterized protein (TIGR00255 family)
MPSKQAVDKKRFAIRSMTAYARASSASDLGLLSVELQSVNRRHLDVQCFLPQMLSHCETLVRKIVGRAIFRGHVQVKIFLESPHVEAFSVTPNLALAKQYYKGWNSLLQALSPKEIETPSLSLLRDIPDLFTVTTNHSLGDAYSDAVATLTQKAVDLLIERKEEEGKDLFDDIEKRVFILQQKLDEIAALVPESEKKYRYRLIEKIEQAFPEHIVKTPEGHIADPQLLSALCIFADKVDITEEIVRFKAHISHFFEIASAESCGKPLEFLVQELNREANTIASKSADDRISHLTIAIKTEIERIREQLQNIE